MNSTPRYFLEPSAWQKDTLTLTGGEAHHCARVLRSKVGDAAEIFDGEGRNVSGILTSVNKDQICIDLSQEPSFSTKLPAIHLLQSIPKGSNMEFIVQKAAELGVTSIQPIMTEHTVARPEQLSKKTVKWQRIALEACKQCGQNYLPKILPVLLFKDWATPQQTDDSTKLIAALQPNSQPLAEVSLSRSKQTSILIGPEGDFSDSEYEQAYKLGFQPVSLGSIVLRVETATLYCMSVLRHELSTF